MTLPKPGRIYPDLETRREIEAKARREAADEIEQKFADAIEAKDAEIERQALQNALVKTALKAVRLHIALTDSESTLLPMIDAALSQKECE